MDIRNLTGSIVALVTPFDSTGAVDFEALERLVDFHLEAGTDAILALGTTGESSTMTHEEDDEVIRCVVERVAGRIPVIAGSGSNCTETMLMKSLSYQKLGADGLLVITPYYNKSNEEGIYQHFKVVADAVDIPCILYNIPGRCGCSISIRNLERLSAHPNIMGLKEASGNVSFAAEAAQLLSDGFRMLLGRGRAHRAPHGARRLRDHLRRGPTSSPRSCTRCAKRFWTATRRGPARSRSRPSRSSRRSSAR